MYNFLHVNHASIKWFKKPRYVILGHFYTSLSLDAFILKTDLAMPTIGDCQLVCHGYRPAPNLGDLLVSLGGK